LGGLVLRQVVDLMGAISVRVWSPSVGVIGVIAISRERALQKVGLFFRMVP
jgi:hypothetical protein